MHGYSLAMLCTALRGCKLLYHILIGVWKEICDGTLFRRIGNNQRQIGVKDSGILIVADIYGDCGVTAVCDC
jgi:hypothetical protein